MGKIGRVRLLSPVSVVRRNGIFYVADAELRKILAFDGKGALLFEIAHDLTRPSGLAISGERLIVADAPAHCVVVFDLAGKCLFKFGRRGDGPGTSTFPLTSRPTPGGTSSSLIP